MLLAGREIFRKPTASHFVTFLLTKNSVKIFLSFYFDLGLFTWPDEAVV